MFLPWTGHHINTELRGNPKLTVKPMGAEAWSRSPSSRALLTLWQLHQVQKAGKHFFPHKNRYKMQTVLRKLHLPLQCLPDTSEAEVLWKGLHSTLFYGRPVVWTARPDRGVLSPRSLNFWLKTITRRSFSEAGMKGPHSSPLPPASSPKAVQEPWAPRGHGTGPKPPAPQPPQL